MANKVKSKNLMTHQPRNKHKDCGTPLPLHHLISLASQNHTNASSMKVFNDGFNQFKCNKKNAQLKISHDSH